MLLYDGAKNMRGRRLGCTAKKYQQIEITQVPTLFSGGWLNVIWIFSRWKLSLYWAMEKAATKGQNYMLPQPGYKTEVELWDVKEQKISQD